MINLMNFIIHDDDGSMMMGPPGVGMIKDHGMMKMGDGGFHLLEINNMQIFCC